MLSVAMVGAFAAAALVAAPAYAAPSINSAKKLTKAVTIEGVYEHLEAFQDIADTYGDRAAGRPGYAASVDYVVEELEGAGYDPTVQAFDFDYFEENSELARISPLPTNYVNNDDFLRNAFDSGSPKGTATGTLYPVDVNVPAGALPPNSNSSGCEPGDFIGFPVGAIAFMQRGTCGFALKALNAQAAGASGVIIMNEGQPGRDGLLNMIGDATGLTIPAVFTTSAVGEDLYSTSPGTIVTVTVDYEAETRTAYNVFAQTSTGSTENVVMAGAHLDSVQDGPGINDNGSGSAALLETAIQLQKTKLNNAVRFAWWGAEEEGLLGSEYYVENLSDEEIEDIGLYLNFDMIGSPNYMFGVYDGDNSGGTAPEGFIPPGSAEIEDVFEMFYESRGLPYQDSEFSGRSDYGPFIAVGIPAGGLFTGAEGVKTPEEAALYGGIAGESYDQCYHEPCDTIDNVNAFALDVNADALATAVITFAYDSSTVNGVSTPGKSHGAGNSGDAFMNRLAG
ncbi:M28 family peptidase [Agromyces mangrovi Wang et al. 2018]|uniref:M28 family peptidase n=1 Tax=Agromyces mangrovi TaxID=1858653 RepID=UPI0025738CAF|nr:M28 family peptidase [Agromyces mangrovi]BDZ65413.1 aminopeptidase [Agromyces mangrovi]